MWEFDGAIPFSFKLREIPGQEITDGPYFNYNLFLSKLYGLYRYISFVQLFLLIYLFGKIPGATIVKSHRMKQNNLSTKVWLNKLDISEQKQDILWGKWNWSYLAFNETRHRVKSDLDEYFVAKCSSLYKIKFQMLQTQDGVMKFQEIFSSKSTDIYQYINSDLLG